MAINRAPFNALLDDDGSNLVGSIWNKAAIQTVLLDPIDAAIAPATGTWTPVDASGAGLVFTITTARYWRYDKFVAVIAHLAYPATANGNQASVGGLPFVNGPTRGALTSQWAPFGLYMLLANASAFSIYESNGGARTNAQQSGGAVMVGGYYLLA